MKSINRNLQYLCVALVALVIGTSAATVFGQKSDKSDKEARKSHAFCDQNNSWSDDSRVSFKELRELTASASGDVNVDGNRNGGISVIGENRSDVLVRACVQTSGKSDEDAKSLADSIKINTSGTIKADSGSTENWSVSYELHAPNASNLNLTARNGGISVRGVDGAINFETVNGGVNLNGVAGTVKGHTTNGGVNVTLIGSSWKGTGLDVTTTNGGVMLNVPANFGAHVEAGTVNGGFTSDIVGLQPEKEVDSDGYYRPRPKKVSTDINGGGPLVRAITTNGGVRINTLEQ